MDGVSGVSGYMGPVVPPSLQSSAAGAASAPGANAASTAPAAQSSAASGGVASTQIETISALSVSASVESFVATYGPVMSNNELLGAVLLLLTMEYLKSEDPEEKKGLLALIATLAQQSTAAQSAGSFAYSSSSLSIESLQYQAVSTQVGAGTYAGDTAALQQAAPVDPGAAGLDVVA